MENRIYGYGRVSDKDQNEERQVKAFIEHGISERNIKIDKASGKDFNRKGYLSLVGTAETDSILREGDLLVVLSIDRLGRNYTEIQEQWRHITQTIKADIKVLDMPLLDTSAYLQNSLDGRFMADLVLQILSYVAEKERDNIKKRQAQGIQCAKEKGTHIGRPKVVFPNGWVELYEEWTSGKVTAKVVMENLGLKRTTFYKLVAEWEQKTDSLEAVKK